MSLSWLFEQCSVELSTQAFACSVETMLGSATTATITRRREGGEDGVKDNPSSPRFHPNRVVLNAIHPKGSVFRALFLVLFGFAVLAQYFAVGIDFEANLLAVLIYDGFKIGALFFPTNNGSALGLCLGGRLHRGRNFRTIDRLLFVFFFFRLCGNAERQASAYRSCCEQIFHFHDC